MTDPVLELASITRADDKTEDQLLAASEAFQRDFLDHQDGFLRRDLVRRGDGTYADVILWESRLHADAVFERARRSEVVANYFAHMNIDQGTIGDGVEHCAVLCSFARD